MPIDRLPTRIQPFAHSIRDYFLTDGPAFLLLALSIIPRGISYLPSLMGSLKSSHTAENLIPINLWAAVWIAVGALCIFGAAQRGRGKMSTWAFSLGVGLHVLWACSFVMTSIVGASSRAWVSSISYFVIALFAMWSVWKGSRLRVTREEVLDELRN